MCIHNPHSVLKFCYPNNFVKSEIFSRQGLHRTSQKAAYYLTLFSPLSLCDCVCRRTRRQKKNLQIEQLKKFIFLYSHSYK